MNSQMTVAAHVMGMLAYHASQDAGPVTSEALAESVGTNPVVIRRVLSQLKEAGLIESRRGIGGGSVLAKAPEQINLHHVYDAVTKDEANLIGRHASPCGDSCNIAPAIVEILGELYADAERALFARLAEVTVADLLEQVNQRAGGCPKAADKPPETT